MAAFTLAVSGRPFVPLNSSALGLTRANSTVNSPVCLASCSITPSPVSIEECRKPVVVETTSTFFGAACTVGRLVSRPARTTAAMENQEEFLMGLGKLLHTLSTDRHGQYEIQFARQGQARARR